MDPCAPSQSPETQFIHVVNMASYTNGESNNGETKGIQPKITLYTNHLCPFAHRAHITLEELGLDFEEVIIDLDKPREQWYLDINPRGLVPSIKYTVPGLYDEEIITESSIVAQFLADARPSHLLPGSLHDPFAPLFRARLAFFVDTWNTKVQGSLYPMMKAEGEEKEKLAKETVAAIEKEIEPLLANAAPFFGGKDKPTLAEVCFVYRLRLWGIILIKDTTIGYHRTFPYPLLCFLQGRQPSSLVAQEVYRGFAQHWKVGQGCCRAS